MKFPDWLPVYGHQAFRGLCATESQEQVAFFDYIRRVHPAIAAAASHQRNEGKRSFAQARWQKKEGLITGAADILIPARVAFVCELKRQDHTKSAWKDGQQKYLAASLKLGAFVCVALGWEAAVQALNEWRKALDLP